jgi:hypothetical protein
MRCIINTIILLQRTNRLRTNAFLREGLRQLHPAYQQRRRLRGAASLAMSPRKDSVPHELRTAAEPRQNKLYTVRLMHVEQISPTIRLLRLSLPTGTMADEEEAVCHISF